MDYRRYHMDDQGGPQPGGGGPGWNEPPKPEEPKKPEDEKKPEEYKEPEPPADRES